MEDYIINIIRKKRHYTVIDVVKLMSVKESGKITIVEKTTKCRHELEHFHRKRYCLTRLRWVGNSTYNWTEVRWKKKLRFILKPW